MTTLVINLAVAAPMAAVAWFVNRQPDAETMDPDQLGGDHRPPT